MIDIFLGFAQPPPPHQKSNGPPLTENAWSCEIEIWKRVLASNEAFERGSSFCSLTRPKLQNEDPVSFASFGVLKSVWARVFVL